MTLAAGTRLGPYEIVAPLGAGGMGEVYRAEDTRLGREVAIKVLAHELAADADRLRRFEQEARTTSALSHPNLLTLFDLGEHDGRPFLVTELLEGQTLRERLGDGPVEPRHALDWAAQIARGLAAAHEKGVVHRDLKPENLFLCGDSRVKILDFGLAKLRSPRDSSRSELANSPTLEAATEAGLVVGTAGYMSPEQVRGEAVDARSDIFAFGCVLYELVAGQRAFARPSAVETMAAILRDEPEPVAEHGAPLERLLAHCLEKRPGDRFQSARDLAFALDSLLADTRAPGRAPSPRPAASAASVAVLPFVNLSGDSESDYFGEGVAEEILTALARVPGLRVAPRASAFSFRGKDVELQAIARKLDVATILEGSVRRAGKRVRVAVRLVSVEAGFPLWSETFDRELDDLFAIQEEIAQAIAHRLAAGTANGAEAPGLLVRPGTQKLEAYDLYLRGRAQFERRGRGLIAAVDCFEQALAIDADNPRVLAALAETKCQLAFYSAADRRVALPEAARLADRAIELDPLLAEAWAARALVAHYHEYDWPGARARLERALELSPGLVSALAWLSAALSWVEGDREAGLEVARRARRVDPLGIQSRLFDLYMLLTAARWTESEAALDELERDHPQLWLVYRSRAVFDRCRGRPLDSIASAALAVSLSDGNPLTLGELGLALAAAGYERATRRLRDQLAERGDSGLGCPLVVALLSSELGERDAALDWLDRAIATHDPRLILMGGWPACARLASDPAAQERLERVGVRGKIEPAVLAALGAAP